MTEKKHPKSSAVGILSDGLVELSVSQPEFDPSENSFIVTGFVACQPKQVHKTENEVFVVSVKQVLLKESCFGCKPIPGSFFQEITQAGKLERVSKNEQSTGRSAKISGAASGQASVVGAVKASISGGTEGSRDFENRK